MSDKMVDFIDVKEYYYRKLKAKTGTICLIVVGIICLVQFIPFFAVTNLGMPTSEAFYLCFDKALAFAIIGCIVSLFIQQSSYNKAETKWNNMSDAQKQIIIDEYYNHIQRKSFIPNASKSKNKFSKNTVIVILVLCVILALLFHNYIGTIFGIVFVALLVRQIMCGTSSVVPIHKVEHIEESEASNKQRIGKRVFVPGTGCNVDPDTGVYYDYWFDYPVPAPVQIKDDKNKK